MAKSKKRINPWSDGRPFRQQKPVRSPFCCKKAGDKTPQHFSCPKKLAGFMESLPAPIVTLQLGSGEAKAVIITDEMGQIVQVTACKPQTSWHAKPSRTFRTTAELGHALEGCHSGIYRIEGKQGSALVQLKRGIPTHVR